METDFISREKALKQTLKLLVLHVFRQDGSVDSMLSQEQVFNMLREIPVADVVEVVRCRECRDWDGNRCSSFYGLYAPDPNGYCYRGVRCDHG